MKRLLKYFKSEFPNDVVDIRDSIDLLYQCLNSTVKKIEHLHLIESPSSDTNLSGIVLTLPL